MDDAALQDLRILVVEDQYILASELERDLGRAGAVVLGPAPTVTKALELIAREAQVDAAVLDLDLDGVSVLPVAKALAARGAPFVLVTGYDAADLPAAFADIPRCEKPVKLDSLRQAIGRAVRRGQP